MQRRGSGTSGCTLRRPWLRKAMWCAWPVMRQRLCTPSGRVCLGPSWLAPAPTVHVVIVRAKDNYMYMYILARTCPDSLGDSLGGGKDSLGAVAVSPGRGSPFGLPPRPLPLYPCRSSPSGVGSGQQGGRIDPLALVPAPRRNRALWCGGSAVRGSASGVPRRAALAPCHGRPGLLS